MLSNAYFLAKFRFDTAENEPAKKLQNFRKMHFSKNAFFENAFSTCRPAAAAGVEEARLEAEDHLSTRQRAIFSIWSISKLILLAFFELKTQSVMENIVYSSRFVSWKTF